MNKEDLVGKFVIAYNTLCDGHQAMMDGKEGDADYAPALFDSYDEAFKEIFYGNVSMLESHIEDDHLVDLNENVTEEMVKQMREIYDSGNVDVMKKFMEEHEQCNDSGSWVEPADEFIMNRKTFWVSGSKLEIRGTKLEDWNPDKDEYN